MDDKALRLIIQAAFYRGIDHVEITTRTKDDDAGVIDDLVSMAHRCVKAHNELTAAMTRLEKEAGQ